MIDSIVKCDDCLKNDVCKYQEEYLATIEKLKNISSEDRITSIKVSCHYWKAIAFNYKTPG